MAQLTYLQLTNRILGRVTQPVITDVTTATGIPLIATQLINEAQNELFTETNWYSLFASRAITTVASTATYAVASDFGRSISLTDETNNIIICESIGRVFDMADPVNTQTGNPEYFALQAGYYRLYPIPAGAYTLRDRYWKQPTTLSANANTSDLPIETENCIIQWALYKLLEYLNKFEAADRGRVEFERMLGKATSMNRKKLDMMFVMSVSDGRPSVARLPNTYGQRLY